MNPVTHALIGWTTATAGVCDKRERALVTLAGLVPDFDAFGIVAEKLTVDSAHPLLWWTEYHHVLGHNLAFGLVWAAIAAALVKRRLRTAALVLVSFHLHLLGDLAGGKGPEGFSWPIVYFYPVSSEPALEWAGQWALNAWPNFLITAALLGWMFAVAVRKGYSPLEMVSARADTAFVRTLRERFGGGSEHSGTDSYDDKDE